MEVRVRNRSAARGSVVLVVGVGATSVLNYAFGVTLAWLLPKDEFGAVGVMQNVVLLAGSVLAAGFPWALARAVSRDDAPAGAGARSFRTALVGNAGLGAALAVGLLVVQLATGRLLPGASGSEVALVIATVLVLSVSSVLAGALQGWRRFDALSLARILEIGLKVLLGLALGGLAGFGVGGVALALLVSAGVGAAWACWSARDRLPGQGPLEGAGAFAAAVPIGLATTGFGLLITVDVILLTALGLGHGVTYAAIGTYQAAAILARAPFFLGDAISDAVFPFIAGSRSRAEAHRWFVAGFRWVPIGLVPLQLVLVVAPEPVLGLVFPAEYAGAATLVRIISIGTTGLLAADMLLKALIARGIRRSAAAGATMAVAVEVITLVVLVPRLGPVGAAVGFALGAWASAGLLACAYLRQHRLSWVPRRLVTAYGLSVAPLLILLAAAALLPGPFGLLFSGAGPITYAVVAVRTGLIPASDVAKLRRAVPGIPEPRHAVDEPDTVRLPVQVRRPSDDARGASPPPSAPPRRSRGAAVGTGLVRLGCAVLAGTAVFWNIWRSPDTMYDELSYVRAAQEVAQEWALTWSNQPVFVHPPISFLIQAGWLKLLGMEGAAADEAVRAARLLAGLTTTVVVLLVGLLAAQLAVAASRRRRLAVVAIVVALAATDPILLRYLRMALIEPYALLISAVTLALAIKFRHHRATIYVPLIGTTTGLALLTKEMSIFIVAAPVIHAVIGREWRWAARASTALVAGVALWVLFPLWAVQLGLWSGFADEKFLLFERLLGVQQTTGWNRPGLSTGSFVSAVIEAGSQYASSYALLAAGALATLWLFLHRTNETRRWLFAWLLGSYAFGAYTVLFGSLNEHLFVWVLPAAIVGTVLVTDATLAGQANRRASRGAPPRRLTVPRIAAGTALAVVLGFAAVSWVRYYVPPSDGVFQSAAAVRESEPSCSTVNGIGDAGKWAPLLPQYTVADYATAQAALSHGVHLFFLSGKDAEVGNALPELPGWVRAHGEQLATFPSATYRGIELWRVESSPYDPLADVEPIPDGSFVTTEGSRCGGYEVVNGPAGEFAGGWTALGGKALTGPPLTSSWTAGGQGFQALRGAVLVANGREPASAEPIVAELASRDPAQYRGANLPPVTVSGVGQSLGPVVDLLSDPQIATAYLGVPTADATPDAVERARARLGSPLGPPATMPDGFVRQPFAGGVLERDSASGAVRLAPVGALALTTGLVTPPEEAQTPTPPPPLLGDSGPDEPTSVRPFVLSLIASLGMLDVVLFASVILGGTGRRWRSGGLLRPTASRGASR